MQDEELEVIKELVGNITKKQLRHVDCYVSQHLGIFVPSVGFCEYAIMPCHTHPSYSFTLFFSKEQSYMPIEIEVALNHYAGVSMSPDFPHEEPINDTFLRYIAIFISEAFYHEQYHLYKEYMPKSYKLEQFAVSEEIMAYIKQFMKEYENKQIGYEEMLEALAKLITHMLIRAVEGITDKSNKEEQVDEKNIAEVIAYIHQNFGEKLTIKRLAEIINMSESHFIRMFKKQVHLSPIAYLIKTRIQKCKKLLRDTSQSITEIALQCGFNSTSHFSAVFTKQIGMTPTEYRELYINVK